MSAKPVAAKHIIIHHLSDIHFGEYQKLLLKIPRRLSEKIGGTYAKHYINYLKCLPENDRPHFIVISGDLASVGNSSELRKAANFCKNIVRFIASDKKFKQEERLIVVPGNHDTCWEESRIRFRISNFKE